jgi:ADP-ribose pyrophosphatase YjhB (NUDIX family)
LRAGSAILSLSAAPSGSKTLTSTSVKKFQEVMSEKPIITQPSEQIAFWADLLRDLSAAGLNYANNSYDKNRYQVIQNLAMEMLAYATDQDLEIFSPLKPTIFSRMSPVVAGAAAVIDGDRKILLMRRSDNGLWSMPAGQMEVGETPAEAVVRETLEETGIRCIPKALVGIYDSRRTGRAAAQHIYKFTFLCVPLNRQYPESYDPHETLETGWFAEDELPADLYEGHHKRIMDAYRIRDGAAQAYFDQ